VFGARGGRNIDTNSEVIDVYKSWLKAFGIYLSIKILHSVTWYSLFEF